jgi:uncharacterized protein YbjT (DUF2867 family)
VILVTTPTGRIGRQLVRRLLERDTAIRVIVRDPARLDPDVRTRLDVVVGTHDDPAVLDAAMQGVSSLFWLVPPNAKAANTKTHYLRFARVAAHAIRQHAVPRVVAVSSAGHSWPKPAGVLSAAFAMDDELARTGAAYRALSAPFFMDNLLGQANSIREHGVIAFANAANRPLATVATRDIADTAAALLADPRWSGQENVPVFGPDRLTPNGMTKVIADELGRAVSFRQLTFEQMASALRARGATAGVVEDMLETTLAVDAGIYDADQNTASPGPTDFRSWCREVLRPFTSHQP